MFNKINEENKTPDLDEHNENKLTADPSTHHAKNSFKKKQKSKHAEKNMLETYNLTHDNSNGFKLKFDDINWIKNSQNLRPLVKIKIKSMSCFLLFYEFGLI